MNILEKYISENKSLFGDEPAAGHFERLQQRMARESSDRRTVAIRRGMSIAASIAILFIVGNIVFQNIAKQNEICENAVNMKICYIEKMNVVAGQIEELIVNFDQLDRQLIMNDVQYIFETINDDFESEIPKELPEYLTKEILSEYYRQNLESLEMIVESIIN